MIHGMKTALVAFAALCVSGAAWAGDVVFDVDFADATRRVDAVKVGSFHGVLPNGVDENFAGWSAAHATSEVREEGGRRFLRIATKPGEASGQFCISCPKISLPGVFRLKVVARVSDGRALGFGLRQTGAPYTSFSASTFRSSEWKEESFLFHVKKGEGCHASMFFYTFPGETDIARVSMETATIADLAAQIPRPPKSLGEYVRHSRFPLGMPSGWNLGRDCMGATCAADSSSPAPDGVPMLKVESANPWELWSEPFQTAYPGEMHAVTFFYRAAEPVTVVVMDDSGTWVASRPLAASEKGAEARIVFKAGMLANSFGVRFSGAKGAFWLNRFHVRPDAAGARSASGADNACSVSLAPGAGEIAGETRIQFTDEPAQMKWCVLGAPKGAVLRMTACDLYGREAPLPDVALSGAARQDGTFAYDVFKDRPLGQFRVGAWVEKDGRRVSAEEELVMTRLARPVAWGGDAADSPFGGHFNPCAGAVKAMKAGGVNWVRLHDAGEKVSNWFAQETEKGKWNFHDAEVACYRENGVKIFGQLGTSPAWASHYGTLGCQRMGYFEKYLRPTNSADWVNYVAKYVKRHEKSIDEYFVWNEPWGGWWATAADAKFFAKDRAGADYAELTRLAYEAVKKVNPAIKVSGFNSYGAETGAKWSADVMAAGGLSFCDAIDWHYYTPRPRAVRGDAVITEIPLAPIRKMAPDLAGRPVYMSEGQGTTSGGDGASGRMSGLMRNVPWPAESREGYTRLADATCRYVLSLLAEGNRRVFLYTSHSYVSLARPPQFLTLLGADGFAHPELVAHSAMARAIETKAFERRFDYGRKGVAFSFACPGERVVAYAGLEADELAALSATAKVYDLYGNPVAGDSVLPGSLVYAVSAIDR